MELIRKDAYSQKAHNEMRVRELIPVRTPKLPTISPAATVEITPDKCKDWANRKDPYARIVVSMISICESSILAVSLLNK